MTLLRFMGEGEPEAFRCRVYGEPARDPQTEAARAFLAELERGWIETEEGDPRHAAIAALESRGLVASRFEPTRGGRLRIWFLTPAGRAFKEETR